MTDSQGRNLIVCDNGTGLVKCGYADTNSPEFTFPSLVGTPQLKSKVKIGNKDIELKSIMCGDQAAQVRQFLDVTYPMSNGQVRDWEAMNHLWDYTFHEKMKIDCSNSKVLLSEPPMNPKSNRQKMFEVMFERYNFHGCMAATQAVLTLYARGLLTGVAIDSGDGVTHVCPVYEGTALPASKLDLAGRDITAHLIKLLLLRGYVFNNSADFETVKMIKEKLAYVAYDIEAENKLADETTVLNEKYTLPDGRVINVGKERFECSEVLFQPDLIGLESEGVSVLLYDTIMKQTMDTRPELFKHIVLSGGTTMLKGFPSRLEREVKQLYLKNVSKGDLSHMQKMKIKVEDPPSRHQSVFLGGSVLAHVSKDNDKFWINKSEYQEKGIVRCIQEKCTGPTATM